MVEHMRTRAEAFNVLTPEQQDELRDLLDDMDWGPGPRGKGRRGSGRG
jgi:Spy/CpxP family protein refolding chaperone